MVSLSSRGSEALGKGSNGLSRTNPKNVIRYKKISSKRQKDHIAHGQCKGPDESGQEMTPESNQEVFARKSPCLFEEAHPEEDHVAVQLKYMLSKRLASVPLQGQTRGPELAERLWFGL